MIHAAPPKTGSKSSLREEVRKALACELGYISNSSFSRRKPRPASEVLASAMPEDTASMETVSAPVKRSRHAEGLEALCGTPLLSPAEERAIFDGMNYCKHMANGARTKLDENRPSEKVLRDFHTYRQAAIQLRQRIVSANLRLVVSLVKGFVDQQNNFDDLFSEGVSALIRAADSFDFDRGFRFSTYATCAIRRELAHFVERQAKLRKRFSTGYDAVLAADFRGQRGFHPAAHASAYHTVTGLLDLLDERERFIVTSRYGFDSEGKVPTFESLGLELGVCKERVRQLEARALKKLRKFAKQAKFDPYADRLTEEA